MSKSSSSQGWDSENRALKYFTALGFRLWARRLRTPFAELDLVFKTPEDQFLIVEVKTLSSWEFVSIRVSSSQKMRLTRARLYFESKYGKEVRLCLAFVDRKNQVTVVET